MSHNLSERESEFMFAADLLTFVLKQYQISWECPNRPLHAITRFRPSIGYAILNYMIKNTTVLRSLWGAFFPGGLCSLEVFNAALVELFLQRPGNEVPVVIVICALVCHVATFCARMSNLRPVDDFVGIIASVVWVKLGVDSRKWREFEEFAEERNEIMRIPSAA
ncbi:uncharacterized protein TNCT_609531 [Trichonephila clavata]|uniref:Uncharacterized protein n=1 Tax=Trichonephila clavata TaxID=2740835 RepID=A0A8X6KL83_TRICU|nr:uncharacterized protein TNCT_609531 [Trichonephila clavata]